MASTGNPPPDPARRLVLRALALAPLAACGLAPRAEATDYASASDVFAAVDRLEAEVAARLRAIAAALPSARAFADSVLGDQERHRGVRGRLRARLGLAPAAAGGPATAPPDLSLEGLRTAQEALVYAHAEGLPALGDPLAVDAMAHDMVDLARQLAVISLWIEMEGQRG